LDIKKNQTNPPIGRRLCDRQTCDHNQSKPIHW